MPDLIQINNPTIYDVLSGQTDGKTVTDLVNLLSQENPILADMSIKECNQNDQNKEMVMTSLPTIHRRKYNQGVPSSKGSRAALVDATSQYVARCQVDRDLAMLNGGTREFLFRENAPFIESMSQGVAHDLFYGATSPGNDGLIGFAERYSTLTRKNPGGTLPETADYIIDAGGTGNNLTSMWMIVWGLQTCFTIFPKGSKAGLEVMPTELKEVNDESGNPFWAHVTFYSQKIGLCIKDLRSVVRIANIDVDAINSPSGDKTLLTKALIDAWTKIKGKNSGRPVIYCNDSVTATLWKNAVDRNNVMFQVDLVEGKPVVRFNGIPIRVCDAIISTEAQVI